MSTIFTNQTPWITLADAFGVLQKTHDFFFAKNVDKLLSLVPTGEPLFRAEIMSASDHKLHTLDLISRRIGCFFNKNAKILDGCLRRTWCILTKKGWSPFAEEAKKTLDVRQKKQKKRPQKGSSAMDLHARRF